MNLASFINIKNKYNIILPNIRAEIEHQKHRESSPKNALKPHTSLHSIFVAVRKIEQQITETKRDITPVESIFTSEAPAPVPIFRREYPPFDAKG